jgi:cellulose biosynthesis protein BcsQ
MIVTFYSYKGGTGRTMALANIAGLLSRRGKKVLAVDFDLEAPGLWRYFDRFYDGLQRREGLIDLLQAVCAAEEPTCVNWRDYVTEISLQGTPVSLMTSGQSESDYASRVLNLDWRLFFRDFKGGEFIESMRAQWKEEFDFTLIDSRTGITDAGGICTILLPDLIAPVFVSNRQSLEGVVDVITRAQAGRNELSYDRPPAAILPILSRFDSRTEWTSAQEWLDIAAQRLGPFYADWLPKDIAPRIAIERTKLPYIAYFSFGETLPALGQGISDPDSLGYALNTISRLIESELEDARSIIGGPGAISIPETSATDLTSRLLFRRVTGEQAEAEMRVDSTEFPAGEFLVTRRVWLGDGTELRQHRVAKGSSRSTGYDRLDNEILTGRRLYEIARWNDYPAELARLYGDEASSADPYALLESYRGEPLREVATHLMDYEQEAFFVSLLTGLCWLAAAGIAHCALNPHTVLWDSQRRQAQITDFSQSAVFGAPREAIEPPGWVAREHRRGSVMGKVSDRDDIWAAGRLLFYVRSRGEELTDRSQLAASGLTDVLDGVFGPPEGRPTARELLVERMGLPSPVRRGIDGTAWLEEGRRRFWEERERKYPGAALPQEAGEDSRRPDGPTPPDTVDADALKVADARMAADVTAQVDATAQKSKWRRRSPREYGDGA